MAQTKIKKELIDASFGTDWQSAIKTSNFTSEAGKGYFVDTTSGAVTATLPAGVVGSEIVFQDYTGTFATNSLVLSANGSEKMQGTTGNKECRVNNSTVRLIYQDATEGWTADNITAPAFNVQYLVIAGGGGGNIYNGGGGGAGGYRSAYNNETSGGGGSAETALTLQLATNYTVTVGGGGTAGVSSANYYRGYNGSNSVFSTITSIGGGGGGARNNDSNSAGQTGGSGGGGASVSAGGNAAGSGTTNQGYDGGTGADLGNYRGGGGGGAGGAGSATGSGGSGGPGVASTITGSSVTRAGGGGAGANSSPGGGGSGGGGAGTNSYTMNSGTANTGSGGGSGGMGGSISGGNGGSGVVILRYPNAYTLTIPGGLTSTTATSGSDKITTFTAGTGTISFA